MMQVMQAAGLIETNERRIDKKKLKAFDKATSKQETRS